MIFYLSDTGNTGWAARTIAEATGDRLLFIPELLRKGPLTFTLADGERLGFCFPVHGWRPPKIVREFVRQLSVLAEGHYVYALCTAGDNIGETMDIFRSDLAAKGIALNAAFSLIMPESYLGLPFFDLDSAKKEQEKKAKAAILLKGYVGEIVDRQSVSHLVLGRWPRINSRVLGGFFTKYLVTDKKFVVDSRLCVKCGICTDVCPVKNVIGGLGYEPQWKHDGSCLACFACYHHCPHHAINWGSLTKHKGQYFFNKKR